MPYWACSKKGAFQENLVNNKSTTVFLALFFCAHMSLPCQDKFGFEDISVTGTGFDIKDNYFLRFTYQSTSLTSDIVLPSSPTRIVFKTPNWASRSGMGGAGALTTLTLFHGDVEVQALTAELSYEFLES